MRRNDTLIGKNVHDARRLWRNRIAGHRVRNSGDAALALHKLMTQAAKAGFSVPTLGLVLADDSFIVALALTELLARDLPDSAWANERNRELLKSETIHNVIAAYSAHGNEWLQRKSA